MCEQDKSMLVFPRYDQLVCITLNATIGPTVDAEAQAGAQEAATRGRSGLLSDVSAGGGICGVLETGGGSG